MNIVQAVQLVLIGGRGYWAPWNWILAEDNFAHNNWIMTRLAIEIGRAKWLLGKLQAFVPGHDTLRGHEPPVVPWVIDTIALNG